MPNRMTASHPVEPIPAGIAIGRCGHIPSYVVHRLLAVSRRETGDRRGVAHPFTADKMLSADEAIISARDGK